MKGLNINLLVIKNRESLSVMYNYPDLSYYQLIHQIKAACCCFLNFLAILFLLTILISKHSTCVKSIFSWEMQHCNLRWKLSHLQQLHWTLACFDRAWWWFEFKRLLLVLLWMKGSLNNHILIIYPKWRYHQHSTEQMCILLLWMHFRAF